VFSLGIDEGEGDVLNGEDDTDEFNDDEFDDEADDEP